MTLRFYILNSINRYHTQTRWVGVFCETTACTYRAEAQAICAASSRIWAPLARHSPGIAPQSLPCRSSQCGRSHPATAAHWLHWLIHNTCVQGQVTVCLHAMNPQVLSCTKTLAYDVVICARTWKKCSCFSLLQKNGCLSTALAVGRRDGSLEIILLIRSRAQMLLESANTQHHKCHSNGIYTYH